MPSASRQRHERVVQHVQRDRREHMVAGIGIAIVRRMFLVGDQYARERFRVPRRQLAREVDIGEMLAFYDVVAVNPCAPLAA